MNNVNFQEKAIKKFLNTDIEKENLKSIFSASDFVVGL